MGLSVSIVPIAQNILLRSRRYSSLVPGLLGPLILYQLLLSFLQGFRTFWLIWCPQLEALRNLESKWTLHVSASGCLRYIHALIPQNLNPDTMNTWFVPCGCNWSPQKYSQCIETMWSSLHVLLDVFLNNIHARIHLFQLLFDCVVITFCLRWLSAPKDNTLAWLYFAAQWEKNVILLNKLLREFRNPFSK